MRWATSCWHAVSSARALLWTAIAAYAAGFAALSILRNLAFNTGRFDLGNMVQAVWATAHGHPLRITDLRGDQISRLAAHFDPLIVVFAPLWRIWPSANLLLTAQAVVVALGALPVFWLARKHLGSERAGLGFALAYLAYPPTQWLTLNEFHPVALACPLLLFAFWFLDEDRLLAFAVFAVLAALSKEEVPLVIAGMGVWYAVTRRRWWSGAAIAGLGLAAAAVAIELVIPHFNRGAASSFYSRYGEIGGSPRGIVHTLVTNPWRILSAAFDARGVRYLLDLVLPLAGLAMLAPVVLVAALPELAINLLSATPTQTSIHFHYTAAEIPVLLVAAIFGARRLSRYRPPQVAALLSGLVLGASIVANFVLGPLPVWQHVRGGQTLQADYSHVSKHDRIAARALRLIPGHAVVSASNSLGAHLSARPRLLSFPYLQDATWVAADETQPGYADRLSPIPAATQLVWLRRNPAWRLVFERDGILVFKRVAPL